MALIKCSECGHEVSDKASACPNCGCPIVKGLVCKECGNSVNPTDKVCPNCGCPISVVEQDEKPQLKKVNNEHPRKSKSGVLIGALVAIFLLGVIMLYFLKNSNNQRELYEEPLVSDVQIEKEETDNVKEKEKQRQHEEELQRQQEEQRRLEEQGPSWIQGTWIYSAYGIVSRVTISGRNITYDMDGSVQYSGLFEYRDGALHFGDTYIDVDEYSQRLKADDTHYFTRSGGGGNYSDNTSSSSDNNEEVKIMARLTNLQNEGKKLIEELAQMRAHGQIDPVRYMFIKQNTIRNKDEQISLAYKLGDSDLAYEYQQQKEKLEQGFRMIENGM